MRDNRKEIPCYLHCGNVKYYYSKMNGFNFKKANEVLEVKEVNSFAKIDQIKFKKDPYENTNSNTI